MRIIPRSVLIISAIVALSLLGDQMLYVVLPVAHKAVGVPVIYIGLLLSANRLVRLLTNTFAGYIIERFGREWPFILALLLGVLTTLAYGIAYGVWIFLIIRLLWGMSWSFIRLEGLSAVLDVASKKTRGRYMGIFQAISRLGSTVALLAGGVLTDMIGFRSTFLLFGGLTSFAPLLAYYEMNHRRSIGTTQNMKNTNILTAPLVKNEDRKLQANIATTGREWKVIWRMRVVNFGTFSTSFIGGLVFATLGYVLSSRFGSTIVVSRLTIGIASLTGFLLSSRGFLSLGFAPIAGYLADRWGRHKTLSCGMIISSLAAVLLGLSLSLPVMIGIILLIFIIGIALAVTFNAVAGDIAPPDKRTTYLSQFVTWQDLGSAAGPLIGYWIVAHFDSFWLYFSGACILLLASGLYTATFMRDKVEQR